MIRNGNSAATIERFEWDWSDILASIKVLEGVYCFFRARAAKHQRRRNHTVVPEPLVIGIRIPPPEVNAT
jgi:hypothetical protein